VGLPLGTQLNGKILSQVSVAAHSPLQHSGKQSLPVGGVVLSVDSGVVVLSVDSGVVVLSVDSGVVVGVGAGIVWHRYRKLDVLGFVTNILFVCFNARPSVSRISFSQP